MEREVTERDLAKNLRPHSIALHAIASRTGMDFSSIVLTSPFGGLTGSFSLRI
jgi:hypothetical protein